MMLGQSDSFPASLPTMRRVIDRKRSDESGGFDRGRISLSSEKGCATNAVDVVIRADGE